MHHHLHPHPHIHPTSPDDRMHDKDKDGDLDDVTQASSGIPSTTMTTNDFDISKRSANRLLALDTDMQDHYDHEHAPFSSSSSSSSAASAASLHHVPYSHPPHSRPHSQSSSPVSSSRESSVPSREVNIRRHHLPQDHQLHPSTPPLMPWQPYTLTCVSSRPSMPRDEYFLLFIRPQVLVLEALVEKAKSFLLAMLLDVEDNAMSIQPLVERIIDDTIHLSCTSNDTLAGQVQVQRHKRGCVR
jgi:hypothetical protein